jgi:hypothetical protein
VPLQGEENGKLARLFLIDGSDRTVTVQNLIGLTLSRLFGSLGIRPFLIHHFSPGS